MRKKYYAIPIAFNLLFLSFLYQTQITPLRECIEELETENKALTNEYNKLLKTHQLTTEILNNTKQSLKGWMNAYHVSYQNGRLSGYYEGYMDALNDREPRYNLTEIQP